MRRRVALLLAWLLGACSETLTVTGADGSRGPVDEGVDPADDRAEPTTDVVIDAPRRERCNGVDDDRDGRIDEGCPIRLTLDPGDASEKDLQNGRVVWNNGRVTWLRALPEGPARRLDFYCPYPSLWNDRIACLGDGEYLVRDLAGTIVRRVPQIDPGGILYPRLRGDILAWTQYVPGGDGENVEVYANDLSTGRTVRVTNDPAISVAVRVEGRSLAWIDDRFGHHRIGLAHQFDLFTFTLDGAQPEHTLTHRAGDLQLGAVMGFDGGRILLTEFMQPWIAGPPPARCQPVLYDAVRGARTELSPSALRCDHASSLSGRRVAVEYDPDGVSDVYLIDASTHARRAVTDYPRRSIDPIIDGDMLVWSDDRNDRWDVYFMDLTDADRGDFSPEGVTP